MISGYPHSLYQPLEDAGWTVKDIKTACYAVGKTKATGILGQGSTLAKAPRIERIWLNPAACQDQGTQLSLL